MTDDLRALAAQFNELREESVYLRKRLNKVSPRLAELRAALAQKIVEEAEAGRPQIEISRATGYTPERIRQICRAAGVEPSE